MENLLFVKKFVVGQRYSRIRCMLKNKTETPETVFRILQKSAAL